MNHLANKRSGFCWAAAWIAGFGLGISPCDLAGAIAVSSYEATVGLEIPDHELSGLANTLIIDSQIASIWAVSVTLHIQDGWLGDYYAYLAHDGFLSVLLNRVGRSESNPFGYSDAGLFATFDDAAGEDVHIAKSYGGVFGETFGKWQPDARNVSPAVSDSLTARDAFLSAFRALPADGEWTLFIADVSPVGTGTLKSWSLEIIGPPKDVPDAAATLPLVLLGMSAVWWFRRCSKGRRVTPSCLYEHLP